MSQPAFPFSFRSEFTDGQSLEYVPVAVRPLGLSELTALSLQPDGLVTLQCLAKDPRINGEIATGTAKMDARLTFYEPVTIYALVSNGGWLPVPFVSPQHFLLDRNVIANFRKLRHNQNFTNRKAHEFWTGFLSRARRCSIRCLTLSRAARGAYFRSTNSFRHSSRV